MDVELKQALLECDTDLDKALYRFADDEELYLECLELFLEDPTMADLKHAIMTESWDEAFTAVHALKGVASNMGFIPLFHASAEILVIIRTGRTEEIEQSFLVLTKYYMQITNVINKFVKREERANG